MTSLFSVRKKCHVLFFLSRKMLNSHFWLKDFERSIFMIRACRKETVSILLTTAGFFFSVHIIFLSIHSYWLTSFINLEFFERKMGLLGFGWRLDLSYEVWRLILLYFCVSVEMISFLGWLCHDFKSSRALMRKPTKVRIMWYPTKICA